jgi:S-adenosylmethionine:tRNA ribosyltransferase-isomerase
MFFDYELPDHLIAQYPAQRRDESRLMVLRRRTGSIEHHIFRELPQLLDLGDLLVMNNTRVLPARLYGRRQRTGGRWEGLFLGESEGKWKLACQTRGTLQPDEIIDVEPPGLFLRLIKKTEEGHWLALPNCSEPAPVVLEQYGSTPLPPYIRRGRAEACDTERYQTVYASQPGAIAAPTAGLHFTSSVFEALETRGIERTFLTLHVGAGTFEPIRTADFREHVMHAEYGELPVTAADAIQRCRQRNGRVVAVGTTSVRVLETVAATGGIRPWQGETRLYIYPPYEFRAIDALITNFHLPRSTLLLLVGAFAGPELLRTAYEAAIAEKYHFYSYGDAMLIL